MVARGRISDNIYLFNERLREWEDYCNYHRPHGALQGQSPFERLIEKSRADVSQRSLDPTAQQSWYACYFLATLSYQSSPKKDNRQVRNRLTRIYTRKGDDGTIGLSSGERVCKDCLLIKADDLSILPELIHYICRLSDLLFVIVRVIEKENNSKPTFWEKDLTLLEPEQ